MIVQEITRNLLVLKSSKTKYTYLGLLFSLYFVLWLYRALRIPPHLRHIPSVGYFKMLLSFLRKEPTSERNQRLVLPKINSVNKFYLSRLPVDWTIYTIDPIAAKTILLKTELFPKTQELLKLLGGTNPLSRLIGQNSLISVNGHAWKGQRKIMNPAIQRAMPVQLLGILVQKVFHVIDQQNGSVIIIDIMHRLALDALGLALFDFDFESLEKTENNEWTNTYTTIRKGFRSPIPFAFAKYDWLLRHMPSRKHLLKSVDRLNSLLLSVAAKRRQEIHNKKLDARPDHEKDILTLILESEIREDGFIHNEEIKCNLALFFVVGHETTSHALAFCLYHLAYDKSVQNKARQEVIGILGDESKDIIPTIEDCKSMKYIDMVIKESLRRFSIATLLSTRLAEKDTVFGNVLIPQGTNISVDLHALHHDPQLWKDPYKFNPERFAPGGEYEQMKKENGYTFIPFSHGGRQCIGMNLSMAEQRVTLIMMLRKYTINLPDDSIHKNGIQLDHFQNLAPRTLLIQFKQRY